MVESLRTKAELNYMYCQPIAAVNCLVMYDHVF